ncbi:MAG TPA: NTP transferase domain-containing protein [Candidatus Binatia bacterium]|jgi:molybdopterin-guanine dinucleotide biosynthesis protein A/molybdopterin converting factor small subunit|nr:NTP transferase domain-containing protein [Candidatus Binatia bacterium]
MATSEKNQPLAPNFQSLSAIVLAGGKSSRMGRPKALLPFDGEPLITRTVRTLRQLFADIVVVAAPEQELPPLSVTLVRDEIAYQGPVGGIYYGLQAARSEVCFVTSCDAPFLNLTLIAHLVSQIADCDVVVPHWQERLQPLHAVYRRSVVPLLRTQLERGELRPISLYQKVRTREVGVEELCRFDPEGLSFRNLNSPEDYQSALALWRNKRQSNQIETEIEKNQTETEIETAPPPLSSVSVSTLCLNCTVELFGVARLRAKTDRVSLALPAGADVQAALTALAETIPELVGSVLTVDSHALTAGYACNLNGTEFLRDLHTPIRSGDSLLILSSDAGG